MRRSASARPAADSDAVRRRARAPSRHGRAEREPTGGARGRGWSGSASGGQPSVRPQTTSRERGVRRGIHATGVAPRGARCRPDQSESHGRRDRRRGRSHHRRGLPPRGRRTARRSQRPREGGRRRARRDAVLVGVGTVIADDPALTVREIRGRDPLRVIVDTDARTPANAKVVRAKDPQRTMIFVARDADARRTNRLRDAGVLLATVPRADGGLDLGAVLRWLGENGVNTVLSEAGPRVAGALVRAKLADRLLLLLSPIAGGEGPPAFDGVAGAADLHDVRVRRLGDDVAVEGTLA